MITALLLISVLFASTLMVGTPEEEAQSLPYSELMNKVKAGEISRVVVKGLEVEAIAKPSLPKADKVKTTQTTAPPSKAKPEKTQR